MQTSEPGTGLRTGEKIIGVAGVALVISLFLPWWTGAASFAQFSGGGEIVGVFSVFGGSLNAFDGSTFGVVFWVATSIGAIVVSAIAATRSDVNSPVALTAVVTFMGLVSLAFALLQFANPPEPLSRDVGVFLGLFALLGIVGGGWLVLADEGTDG